MKYFTMEELDDIAKELIENPSRETLKKLNDKYNGEENNGSTKWIESDPIQVEQTNVEPKIEENIVQENSTLENQTVLPKIDIPTSNIPVWSPTENTSTTLFNSNNNQNIEENKNINIPFSDVAPLPNLEIQNEPLNNNINIPNNNASPSLEMPDTNTFINNNPMPFNGDLWQQPNNGLNNMMQTTDNFNAQIEQPQINQNPFFVANPYPENNPIAVSEPPTAEGPTMFGQIEQNFNTNAA